MPFWERAGNMAFDYSGGGHHGKLVNGVEWLRNGIYLDGTNYVEIPHSTELDAEYNVSVFASLAKDVDPSWGNIFSKGTNLYWENDNYSLGLDGTTTWFYNDDKGSDSGYTLSELVHHSVAVVADSDNALLSTYIDDALAGSSARTAGAATTNTNVMRIGVADALDEFYEGVIYSFLVFVGTALSPAQLHLLHEDPFLLYRIPEGFYGQTSGAPPSVTIPLILHLFNQMRQ